MAKRLKCWKEVDKSYKSGYGGLSFSNLKKRHNIHIEKIPSGKYKIFGYDSKGRTLINKNTDLKSQATKFAKSYMKKHDKC